MSDSIQKVSLLIETCFKGESKKATDLLFSLEESVEEKELHIKEFLLFTYFGNQGQGFLGSSGLLEGKAFCDYSETLMSALKERVGESQVSGYLEDVVEKIVFFKPTTDVDIVAFLVMISNHTPTPRAITRDGKDQVRIKPMKSREGRIFNPNYQSGNPTTLESVKESVKKLEELKKEIKPEGESNPWVDGPSNVPAPLPPEEKPLYVHDLVSSGFTVKPVADFDIMMTNDS